MDDALFGNQATDRVDRLVAELRKTPGWPVDEARDRALVQELLEQFPGLDLTEEFGKFRTWLIAKGTGKEVRSRGRFQRIRNWCSRAGRTPYRATGAGSRRTSTAARPAEAFGAESSQNLSRW